MNALAAVVLMCAPAQVTESYPGETIFVLEEIQLGIVLGFRDNLSPIGAPDNIWAQLYNVRQAVENIESDSAAIEADTSAMRTSLGQLVTNITDYLTPSVTAIESAMSSVLTAVSDIGTDTATLVDQTDDIEQYLDQIEMHTSHLETILAELTVQTSAMNTEIVLIASYGQQMSAYLYNIEYQAQAIGDRLEEWETAYLEPLNLLLLGDNETQGDLYERFTAILGDQFDQFQTDTGAVLDSLDMNVASIEAALSSLEIDLSSIEEDTAAMRLDLSAVRATVDSLANGGTMTDAGDVDALVAAGSSASLLDVHSRVSVYAPEEQTLTDRAANDLSEVVLLDGFALPYATEQGEVTTIPVWTVTVPTSMIATTFGVAMPDQTLTVDWAIIDGWLRTTLHSVLLLSTYWWAFGLLAEEVRRYG